MIETERLIIKPLSYEQLVCYAQNDASLEKLLNVNISSRVISEDLKEALESTILPNVADTSKNYLFSTLWTAILKSENKMVADLCFYGEPNKDGEIELGYGTYEEYRGRGIMTEMVSAIVEWAQKQPKVTAIIASTSKLNKASYSVLEKNSFVQIAENDGLLTWKRVF